jgi:cytochrome c-type biogenesis protein
MNTEVILSTLAAGLLTGLSPCTLPAYPALLNIVAAEGKNRRLCALAFSMGVMLMFVVFYVAVAFAIKAAGDLFNDTFGMIYVWLYALVGVLCILLALQSLGKVNFLYGAFALKRKVGGGVFGAFASGALFATVISPCNMGFMAVAIFPSILSGSTVLQGVFLMVLYALTMTLPFLVVGFLSSNALDTWAKEHVRAIELMSVIFLFAAGLYLIYLSWISYSLN